METAQETSQGQAEERVEGADGGPTLFGRKSGFVETPEQLAIRKANLDVSKIFLAYLSCNGDALQTARLSDCSVEDVIQLSLAERWANKLQESGLSPVEKDGDIVKSRREWIRMTCYLQGLRLRGIIDAILQKACATREGAHELCFEVAKNGQPIFSTRPIRDLVDATERCHNLLYRAVGDSLKASVEEERDSDARFRDLHLTVIQSLQKGDTAEAIKKAEQVIPAQEPSPVSEFLDDAFTNDTDTPTETVN
jgi:hypothetical protein